MLKARMGELKRAVQALGVTGSVLRGQGWVRASPDRVAKVAADPPDWLAAEQARHRTGLERQATLQLRRELTEALLDSLQDAWFQELKRAADEAEADAVDARWAGRIAAARQEAADLVAQGTPAQVRARIGRERQATVDAARFRAAALARYAQERGQLDPPGGGSPPR